MTSAEAKAAARTDAKARRAAAQAALGPKAGHYLADQFFRHVSLPPEAVLAGYAAMGSEADPSEIMMRAAALGHGLALPCVEIAGTPLVFRSWRSGEALVAGPHGTKAPRHDAPAVTPGVVLVPLLAFDGRGGRLGYGGGYYDRTLAGLRASAPIIAVGLAFSAQEVEEVPQERGDERLDWIVTELGAISFHGACAGRR